MTANQYEWSRARDELVEAIKQLGIPDGVPIWLDVSMKRFEYVHPAGGNEYTSVRITPDELETASGGVGWCDVCKGWEEEA